MHEQSLTREQMQLIGKDLYRIVLRFFTDGLHSYTREIGVTFFKYDRLPYTAVPRSGYFNMSANPGMNKNTTKLNEFKKEIRTYLRKWGFKHVTFNTNHGIVHYGYISGPDDFPMTYLNAIYFG